MDRDGSGRGAGSRTSLTSGDAEETDDSNPGIIVFRSPRSKVRIASATTLGQIKVDVGP